MRSWQPLSGRCPPEDVGGPCGYAEFLQAIKEPTHERHDELMKWYGADFNPTLVPMDHINAEFAKLAKRWTPRPRKKATRKLNQLQPAAEAYYCSTIQDSPYMEHECAWY